MQQSIVINKLSEFLKKAHLSLTLADGKMHVFDDLTERQTTVELKDLDKVLELIEQRIKVIKMANSLGKWA